MATVLRWYQAVQNHWDRACVHDDLAAMNVFDVLLSRSSIRRGRDDKSGGESGNDGSKIHKFIPVAERTLFPSSDYRSLLLELPEIFFSRPKVWVSREGIFGRVVSTGFGWLYRS
jgi:hypothetical protein